MDEQLKLISGAGSAADVMQKYGFLGVGVVLFMVLAGIAWTRDRRMGQATMIAGLLFIVAYGALDLFHAVFPGGQSFISGNVLHVPNSYAVQVHSDQWRSGYAFVRRENDPEDTSLSRQSFLFASRHPPKCLAVAVTDVDPNHEGLSLFNINDTTAEDMKPGTELIAEIKPGVDNHFKLEVWREKNEVQIGQRAMLTDQSEQHGVCADATAPAAFRLPDLLGIAAAYAQTPPGAIGDPLKALQSDDVFLRRQARQSLAQQGSAAFDQIDSFLGSGVYRLQLGALVALNDMPAAERAKAPATLHGKIAPLLNAPDPTLRDAATRADHAIP